jgi:hypothetical protein
MKKIIAFGMVVVVLFSAWLIYSKVTQARRETTYRVAIAPFQRDLRVGVPRSDVEKYLHSRNVQFHAINFGETYLVEIAEEPSWELWCESWRVYIALEFGSSNGLRDVRIRKIGTCL